MQTHAKHLCIAPRRRPAPFPPGPDDGAPQKELAEHVRDSNLKYNEMLKERLDAEEELRSELDKALEKAKQDAQVRAAPCLAGK